MTAEASVAHPIASPYQQHGVLMPIKRMPPPPRIGWHYDSYYQQKLSELRQQRTAVAQR